MAILLAGVDADSRLCGYNNSVKAYDKVYYLVQADITEIKEMSGGNYDMRFTPICVRECPTKDNWPVDCVPTDYGGTRDMPGIQVPQCR